MTKTSSKKVIMKNVTLADGSKHVVTNNKDSHIRKGKLTKHVIPKKKFSTEIGRTNDDWEVTDDLDNSDYPPPSKNPLFRKYWAETIENLTNRSNFQPAHLGLLESLCRLRVELRALDDFVMQNGHTFRVVTVLGDHRRTYPEVAQRMRVLSQIAAFSRLLDLVPKKDSSKSSKKTSAEENWE